MPLQSKLVSEICVKVGSLDGKMTQNRFKMYFCIFFSRKATTYKEKKEILFYFLLEIPANSMRLVLKM